MAKKISEIQKIEKEIKKEETIFVRYGRSHRVQILVVTIFFALVIGLIAYLTVTSGRVYIDKSEIGAPIIVLTPQSPGVLDGVYVREGDYIPADTVVASVDGISIKSKIAGLVIGVQNTPGQVVSSQSPIVQMISPKELKVIGHIEENKGLSDIKVGQKVVFTVDAFGSKQYDAVVDSISPTSRTSDIVFSISDKRQEREFDIKASFDTNAYPELKNGMSAKMWVYK